MDDQSVYLTHVPRVLHITLASARMTIVVFYFVITNEFLPGDNKELLNRIERHCLEQKLMGQHACHFDLEMDTTQGS